MEIPKSFLGYKRENGRVGTRNHVIILPVDDISNACAEAVANNIKGTMALPHSYGRLQFGADLDLHFKILGCSTISATSFKSLLLDSIIKLFLLDIFSNSLIMNSLLKL